ncbi:Senescence regulator S40 [Sesbania bispinosa]|nr:Senescence regulator S40 [Sesbania bispinosa]
MANRKGYFGRRSHLFLPVSGDRDDSLSLTMDSDSGFEFDESDIYDSGCATASANSLEFGRSLHGSCLAKKPSSSGGRVGAPASLPVVMLMRGVGGCHRMSFWRGTRVASFSVHEGVGRTLKGRDLSRVRNAIWAKTGFQD